MRQCDACDGTGVDEYYDTCLGCGGSGRDPDCCEKCDQDGIGHTDDGDFLCEDCLFEQSLPEDCRS